MKAEKRFKNIS